jgi:hypothetical protein
LRHRKFVKSKGHKRQPGVIHSEFARINELVWEVIDVAIVLDPVNIFDRDGKDIRILKRALRKVLTVSLFNKGLVVKYYKELSAVLRHKYYAYETETPPVLTPGNIFREFQFFSFFSTWVPDHEHFERLAPFLSTRHFLPGDSKAEAKAIEDFKSISCTARLTDSSLLSEARVIAYQLGKQLSCYYRSPYKTHISLKAAGSLEKASSEGGRAAEIKSVMTSYLASQVAMASDQAGVSWGSHRNDDYEKSFLDYEDESWMGVHARAGLDSYLGKSILSKALVAAEIFSGPIPVKVITVSEPGYKARIVTTTKWFVNIVQQPMGHLLVDMLAHVPELSSGLSRSDQAWQVTAAIAGRSNDPFKEGISVLSSDLTSATDAIPRDIAATLFSGFCEGLGLYQKSKRMVDVCLKILNADRLVTYKDETFVTKRGIPMGEPLTKGILALFTYFAYKRSLNAFESRHGNVVGGHFFSAGGDDHIAIGPDEFLDGITQTLLEAGAILSETKHGKSKLAVTYCEKTLLVKNLHNRVTVRTINGLDYEKSIMVDSIKVRLLSPASKANENFDSTNCAIGKGKSLGRTLPWMIHRDTDRRRIALYRQWFFFRMDAQLARGSKIYWHLLLPEWAGGLGLGTYQDYEAIARGLPDPSRLLVKQVLAGDTHLLVKFSRFLSNVSIRGIIRDKQYTDLEERVRVLVTEQPSIEWANRWDVIDIPQNLPQRAQYAALNRAGYYLIDDAIDWLLRPIQAMYVWTKANPWSSFSSIPLKKRYASLWDLCATEADFGTVTLTVEDVENFYSYTPSGKLYNVSQIETSWSYRHMPSLHVLI